MTGKITTSHNIGNTFVKQIQLNMKAQLLRAVLKGGFTKITLSSLIFSSLFGLLLISATKFNFFEFTISDILSGCCLISIFIFSLGIINHVCRDLSQNVISYEKTLFQCSNVIFFGRLLSSFILAFTITAISLIIPLILVLAFQSSTYEPWVTSVILSFLSLLNLSLAALIVYGICLIFKRAVYVLAISLCLFIVLPLILITLSVLLPEYHHFFQALSSFTIGDILIKASSLPQTFNLQSVLTLGLNWLLLFLWLFLILTIAYYSFSRKVTYSD